MSLKSTARSLAASLLLAVAAALPAAAQVTTGTVVGTVKDAQGGVIPVYDPNSTRVDGTRIVRDQFPDNIIPRSRISPIAATLNKPRLERFREVFIGAAADAEACLDADSRCYFDQFEYYDQVTFPVFYEASVGEAELCEVFRISPCDAVSLLDETHQKLAGTALFHFGAFLSREWRQNDLMWGRLDGAERIIRCVLPPDSPYATDLIDEANQALGGCPQNLRRKLPLFTRILLAFLAGAVLFRMLLALLSPASNDRHANARDHDHSDEPVDECAPRKSALLPAHHQQVAGEDAQKVQQDHGHCEHRQIEGVRRRRDDGRQDHDRQNRVA